jgi:predicted phosphodiesterase
MTTVVLMSDIHGNLPALEAVADALPPHDAVYVAGDLCLEGPKPAEVVDFIRERGWQAVMGNTDRDIVEGTDESSLKAHQIGWTREQLGEDRLRWLAGLPFGRTVTVDGREAILVVHANPLEMETQLRPGMSEKKLQPFLAGVTAGILAFGHIHLPYLRTVNGILLADVSSVGHPKDLDRRAAFTVIRLDGDRRSAEQVRIPYDMDRTQVLLRSSGMPGAEEEIASLFRASY